MAAAAAWDQTAQALSQAHATAQMWPAFRALLPSTAGLSMTSSQGGPQQHAMRL